MKDKTWNELSLRQKTTVKKHYQEVKEYCGKICQNVKTFWKNHKEADY